MSMLYIMSLYALLESIDRCKLLHVLNFVESKLGIGCSTIAFCILFGVIVCC